MAKRKTPSKITEPTTAGQGEQPYSVIAGETVSYGVGGYKLSNGYVLEDYLPELQGERGRRNFRAMSEYPILGALLAAIEMMVRAVEFKFEPAEADLTREYAEIAEEDMEGMKDPWDDVLTEIITFLTYGFSLMEMVFRINEDGTYSTARLAPRSQETIWEWDIDEHGDLRGVWQWPPFGSASCSRIYIPAQQLLHFKTKMARGNPEGVSIFRAAWQSYFSAKNITNIESIAIERELAGVPVVRIPSAAFKDSNVKSSYEKIARDLKFNSQGGLVIPSDPYRDNEGKPTGTPQYDVELISAAGTRAIDTNAVILRHHQDMVRTVLADFLMLGSGDRGSFALSKSKVDLFLRSLEGYVNIILAELNSKWLNTLWDLNGYPPEMKPELKTGNIAPVNLEELGKFIRDSGLMVAGDPALEDFVRETAGLPTGEQGEAI